MSYYVLVIADKVYECDMLVKQYFQALLPPDRPALDGKHPLLASMFSVLCL